MITLTSFLIYNILQYFVCIILYRFERCQIRRHLFESLELKMIKRDSLTETTREKVTKAHQGHHVEEGWHEGWKQ